MIHGYARVSTPSQTDELQRLALIGAGVERLWAERASGAATSRPVLEQLLDTVRAGDAIVVWRLDRLGRSLGHLVATVNQLVDSGV